jgi:hypothetical protein
LGCGAANPSACGYASARGLALKRPQNKLIALPKVEANPVHVGQKTVEQCGRIGCIRDEIGLALQQFGQLAMDLLVLLGLRRPRINVRRLHTGKSKSNAEVLQSEGLVDWRLQLTVTPALPFPAQDGVSTVTFSLVIVEFAQTESIGGARKA